ncbi:MAG: mechanosensitive ion channel family protein [Bacteroidetes bacterium]|nr:mechanosensitive ion channel family protein [Bacteroidota bacterium]
MIEKMLEYIKWEQLLIFFLIIFATIIAAQVLHYFVSFRKIHNKKSIFRDPTKLKFFSHVTTAVIYIVGGMAAISQVHLLKPVSNSLLAGAGLVTVALSFAAQNALSNIISGFFIVLFRPFGINDRLRFKETVTGVVEDITLRHTIIRDGENKRVIIPNTLINNEVVVNYDFHEENINKTVELILHHSSNIAAAKSLIRDILSVHPLIILNSNNEDSLSLEKNIPINVSNITEKGVFIQISIVSKNIENANRVSYDLLETLIVRLPQVGAWFASMSDITPANFKPHTEH